MKKNVKIMHPLPRVDEIHSDVDKTENAIDLSNRVLAGYNGVPIRQAILGLVTGAIK